MKLLSVPPTDADHVLGGLDAPVVIVEYGDYDCPHTRRAHANLKQLLAESASGVALVFRHFPLRHLHENAEQLAELMQAIAPPELYWAAHERLMAHPRMSLSVAVMELTELGLDVAELSRRGAQAAVGVQADVQRRLRDGGDSTPSFFFNGAPHHGHHHIQSFRRQL